MALRVYATRKEPLKAVGMLALLESGLVPSIELLSKDEESRGTQNQCHDHKCIGRNRCATNSYTHVCRCAKVAYFLAAVGTAYAIAIIAGTASETRNGIPNISLRTRNILRQTSMTINGEGVKAALGTGARRNFVSADRRRRVGTERSERKWLQRR